MKLSARAFELCRIKMGKREVCGFEQLDDTVPDSLSEAEKILDELFQNEMLDTVNGDIHISALGQHFLHMMCEPEQYIMIDNTIDERCIRIYLRNTYYLCVLEDNKMNSERKESEYILELLPTFDLVVGAVAYGLHRDNNSVLIKQEKQKCCSDVHFRIICKAWNEDREVYKEMDMYGTYVGNYINYRIDKDMEEYKSDVCVMINKVTGWMLDEISEKYKNEVQ